MPTSWPAPGSAASRAATRALGLPASELRDLRPALGDVWGAAGEELAERMGEAGPPHVQRRVLERFVFDRRGRGADPPDGLVLEAVRRLGRHGARVDALGQALGMSERQLLRRFTAAAGYGPKPLQRVPRFQRLVSAAPDSGARWRGWPPTSATPTRRT